MGEHYYINKNAQPTGEREIHKERCVYLPDIINRQYLGMFDNCKEALQEAKKFYSNVDGCYYCAPACHKK